MSESAPIVPPYERVVYIIVPCSLGVMLLGKNEHDELCAMFIGETPAEVLQDLHGIYPEKSCVLDESLRAWAAPFAEAVDTGQWPDVPIGQYCLPFQHKVWNALRLIPAGDPLTYSSLGFRVGQPNTRRAMAAAVAANRLATLVACDRVVAKDRGKANYRWLLDLQDLNHAELPPATETDD